MKLKNVRQVLPVKIDTNSGFLNVVPERINAELISLQKLGFKVEKVSQPMIDGRFAYYSIEYIMPELDIADDDEDVL